MIPDFEEVFLYKDMGMIPYTLQEYYEYECTIVCYKKIKVSENVLKSGVNLHFSQMKSRYNNKILDTLYYIRKNAKTIDILNVYGLKIAEALLWSKYYKIWNRQGKVYLKLDIGYYNYQICENDKFFKKGIKKYMLRPIEVVSAETQELANKVAKLYKKDIVYIPNGFSNLGIVRNPRFIEKEDTILTVANLGTWPKATEVLLEAFARSVASHHWTLKLIGSIESGFQDKIDEIMKSYPKVIEQVIFAGEVKDRTQLAMEYKKAKVFILPSRKEGSPLVLAEAISNGCYIITSDQVSSAMDITNDEKYGKVVKSDNIDQLVECICEVCDDKRNWGKLALEIEQYANDKFLWKDICQRLNVLQRAEYENRN